MGMRGRRGILFVVLAWGVCGAAPAADGNASRVNEVLVTLMEPESNPDPGRFELTEADLNAWAAVAVESKRRLGVKSVVLDLKGGNRFTTTAVIDMDEVELTAVSVRMFRALLSGEQTFEVDGRFEIAGGKGRYTVEAARFNGYAVPAWLAGQVLSYLTRNQPPHVDVTEPFDIPFGIRSVRVGSATVTIDR